MFIKYLFIFLFLRITCSLLLIPCYLFPIMTPIFLTTRFYALFVTAALLYVVAFGDANFFIWADMFLCLCFGLILFDVAYLFRFKQPIEAQRKFSRLLSLGDENVVTLQIVNKKSQPMKLDIIDELPTQLQVRDFLLKLKLNANESKELTYNIRPTTRGEYIFGALNVFLASPLGFLQRRMIIELKSKAMTFPSIIQMQQHRLRVFRRQNRDAGSRKMFRLGSSYEFEQIKPYVAGDNFRDINWKASSRTNELQVNMFEDERAQSVYCIIDKSGTMRATFNGISLFDYALNATLAVSNIVLLKDDKAGLITFSANLGTTLAARGQTTYLRNILLALYKEKPGEEASDYNVLFRGLQRIIRTRSLLLFFTNFQTENMLERALPVLRNINKHHVLLVICFKDTEIETLSKQLVTDTKGIFLNTMVQKHLNKQQRIEEKLRLSGIKCAFIAPEDLSAQTINAYLSLKARQL